MPATSSAATPIMTAISVGFSLVRFTICVLFLAFLGEALCRSGASLAFSTRFSIMTQRANWYENTMLSMPGLEPHAAQAPDFRWPKVCCCPQPSYSFECAGFSIRGVRMIAAKAPTVASERSDEKLVDRLSVRSKNGLILIQPVLS